MSLESNAPHAAQHQKDLIARMREIKREHPETRTAEAFARHLSAEYPQSPVLLDNVQAAMVQEPTFSN